MNQKQLNKARRVHDKIHNPVQNKSNNVRANRPKPFTDKKNNRNQGIILINDSDMQHILNKSGKHAKENEYQVHYWGLILRHRAEDNSILDICIPTVYFNYKQEVSYSHIDFQLTDVDDASDAVLPVHNMKVNEIIESGLIYELQTITGVKLEPLSVALNTIHCHPGSSTHQSFSSTDYSNNPDDIGVVFPLAEARDDRPNFAGIMVRRTAKDNVVAHFEYRTANGIINENLVYEQSACAALINKSSSKPSFVSSLFGAKEKNNDYSVMKYCGMNDIFESILQVFKQSEFEAFTDTISPENVQLPQRAEPKTYKPQYGQQSWLDPINKKTIYPLEEVGVVGITQDEYIEASVTLERFKDFNANVSGLTALGVTALTVKYNLMYEMYFGKPDTNNQHLEGLDDETIIEDLIFEILALSDDIETEISQAKETIDTYEKEDGEKKEADQAFPVKSNDPFAAARELIANAIEQEDNELEILSREERDVIRTHLTTKGFSLNTILSKNDTELYELYNRSIPNERCKRLID